MKKVLLNFILFLLVAGHCTAGLRWANTVLGVSSQWGGSQNASQIIGLPNVYPGCGDFGGAWAASSADNQREWIELGFADPAPINNIRIYETFKPGAVDTVYVWNPNTNAWQQVYSAVAANAGACRILNIDFPLTSFNVDKIRIAINSPAVPDFNEYDAVAVNNVLPAPGFTSAAVFFDGTNGAATPAGVMTGFTNFTIEFWLNTGDTRSNGTYWNRPQLIGYANPSSPDGDMGININNGFIGMWNGMHSSGDQSLVSSIYVTDGNWHHVALTDNGSTMILYVDGSPCGSLPVNLPINTSANNLQLSGHSLWPQIMKGIFRIAELRLSNTVRYNGTFTPAGSAFTQDVNTTALYRLDNCATGMNDQSTNASNGIFSGTCIVATTGGVIAGDQMLCGASVPALFTSTMPGFDGQGGVVYQWQDSLLNGTWQDISGATSSSYQAPTVTQTTYFRRRAQFNSMVAYSNTIGASFVISGDPDVYGNNEWNFYGYNGHNYLSLSGISYAGYYTRNGLSFNTFNDWNGSYSPSSATGYTGCSVQNDNFTLVAKRKGFPAGAYTLQIPAYDDWVRVYRNGVQLFENTNALYSLGALGANDSIEIRLVEFGGGAGMQVALQLQDIQAGGIGTNTTLCSGEMLSLTNTQSPYGGYTPYIIQWQDSLANGSWQDIAGASALNLTTGPLTQAHWYRRKVSDNNANTVYSNIVAAMTNNIAGDTSVFGSNAWNFYAFNGHDYLNLTGLPYRGYYTRAGLNFNTNNDWSGNGSPSDASGYQGCPVQADNFTLVAKRKGFPAGSYTLQIPGYDDWVRVYVNGTEVLQNTSSLITLGALGADDSIEVRFVEFFGGAGMNLVMSIEALQPGTIAGNQTFCTSSSPSAIDNVLMPYGGSTPVLIYQWQDSTLASGVWANIPGATSLTYQPGIISGTSYYRRKVKNGPDSAYSNIVTKTLVNTSGDTSVTPVNAWNIYVFTGQNINLNSGISYYGYYTRASMDYNSANDWNGNPSTSAGYQGCPLPSDDGFTYVLKRKGFTPDNYTINILGHDDEVRIYKNGISVFEHYGCCDSHPNISLGTLGSNDSLEIRVGEGGGGAYVNFSFSSGNLQPGVIGSNQVICGTAPPATLANVQPAFGGPAPGSIAYQWQDSVASGIWQNVGGTSATFTPPSVSGTRYYRRKADDGISASVYSNVVSISIGATSGTPSVFPLNQWNFYTYNGNNISLSGIDYRGYYSVAQQYFDTRDLWGAGGSPSDAAGYSGCAVGTDDFTLAARRKGFLPGNYLLRIAHDDNIRVYKDGVQLFEEACCTTSPYINVGAVDANTELEIRLAEVSGPAFMKTDMIMISPNTIMPYTNTSCNSFSMANVTGNGWYDFTDENGNVIASVNPNNNTLGTVTLRVKHFGPGTANIPNATLGKYMPRYFDLQSSSYGDISFQYPVSVRFYYYNTELSDYKNATSQPAINANDMRLYHYDGLNEDCDIDNNAGAGLNLLAANGIYGTDAFYLQSNVNSFSEFGASGGNSLLPVRLLSFEGRAVHPVSLLEWKTADEGGVKAYIIQRSNNGKDYKDIGTVDRRTSNNKVNTYKFTDTDPAAGKNYYRLALKSLSDAFEYTSVIVLEHREIATAGVYPNPVNGNSFTLRLDGLAAGEYTLKLYNEEGQQMISEILPHKGTAGRYIINLGAGFANGLYKMILFNDKDRYTDTVILNR